MRLYRLTPPASSPVTLADVYSHLRLDPAGSPPSHPDDDLLTDLILAATQYLDGYTGVLGRCLITQEWIGAASSIGSCGYLTIPMPVADVTTVEVLVDGAYQPLSPSIWTWRDMQTYAVVRPDKGMSWPPGVDPDEAAWRVTFTAGYGATSEHVPSPLRRAALLLIGGLYENREAIVTGGNPQVLPGGVDMLIAPYRVRPNG